MSDNDNNAIMSQGAPTIRLAYLVSQYPAISHLHPARGAAPAGAGIEIAVASINPPDRPPEKLTAAEQAEARTYCVKAHGLGGALSATLATLATQPAGLLLRGLKFALRLGGTDVKKFAYSLFYFAEALMLGALMARQRLNHLHVHFATPAATVWR